MNHLFKSKVVVLSNAVSLQEVQALLLCNDYKVYSVNDSYITLEKRIVSKAHLNLPSYIEMVNNVFPPLYKARLIPTYSESAFLIKLEIKPTWFHIVFLPVTFFIAGYIFLESAKGGDPIAVLAIITSIVIPPIRLIVGGFAFRNEILNAITLIEKS